MKQDVYTVNYIKFIQHNCVDSTQFTVQGAIKFNWLSWLNKVLFYYMATQMHHDTELDTVNTAEWNQYI